MAAIENAAAERKKQEKLKEYLAEIERLDDKQWERDKYLRNLELQKKANVLIAVSNTVLRINSVRIAERG